MSDTSKSAQQRNEAIYEFTDIRLTHHWSQRRLRWSVYAVGFGLAGVTGGVAQFLAVRPHRAHTAKNNMKPNKLVVGLFGVVGVFGILSWVATGTAKAWFEGLCTLAMAATLVVILVGTVAERRALEAKRKTETGV